MGLEVPLGKFWQEIQSSYGIYILLFLLILCGAFALQSLTKPKLNFPRGPIGLPLVGYLPFLGKEPFKVLDNLSKKYGNVFSLYLGRQYVVILGDITALREAFSMDSTTNRPQKLFNLLPDGGGTGSTNGQEWIEQRRYTVRSMRDIGLGKSTWANQVEEEVYDILELLITKKGKPVDIMALLTPSFSNNICSFVFGQRLPAGPEKDLLNASIDNVMSFFAQSSFYSFFPWLCDILAKLKMTDYYKKSCELSAFNALIRKQIDSHRKSQISMEGTDFINDYIKTIQAYQEEGKETTFNEKNLIGNTQILFLAGSDTSRNSVVWLFLAMATYTDVQAKVHLELDTVAGRNHRATWDDRLKFPYIYATIMEGQRWKPVAPLNPARLTTEDIKICGCDIPKGATIIGNHWGILHDTRYWKDPEDFSPERFLRNNGKELNLKPESYTPFSYGKRKCPGEVVALMEIFVYFTTLMQRFEVRAPGGGKPNLDGILGLSYNPVPQQLCFVPRP